MYEFRMPSLGADMEAGTLVEWTVKPGDEVKRGQVVAVVETQKGAIEVEVWENGTVDRIVVAPGAKVPVGELLAVLRTAGEPASPVAQPAAPAGPAAPAPAPAATLMPSAVPSAAGRARVAPAARKLADEVGIDIAQVQLAEAGGVVSRADVERAAAVLGKGPPPSRPSAPAPDWQAQMRKAIAAAMSRSKREIPHYYLATDIDATTVSAWLTDENLKRSVAERLLPVVTLMKAAALALREVPELNGLYVNDAFRPSGAIHLGMAIAMRGGGLVAPAIHDADKKSLDELMKDLRDLIMRVRGGRLRSSEMADPTVTLTNLGEQGVEEVYGVIYPPQVAIVGFGKITERPIAFGGSVAVRKVVTATLAADHRVSDGHRGALYLNALARLLQSPEKPL
jgi:pyruvate dehydrogenase E2 component (dihydrolipoamide acetyltransferase)